jgi:hypothetical protein
MDSIEPDHLPQKQEVGFVQSSYLQGLQVSTSADCSQICRCGNIKKTEGLLTQNAKLLNLKGNLVGYLPEIHCSPRRMELASRIALFSTTYE